MNSWDIKNEKGAEQSAEIVCLFLWEACWELAAAFRGPSVPQKLASLI